jgi:hypothetical protein
MTVAKYKVQGPDGAVHVFEGPDGASQDQVLAFAQQHFGQQKPAPPDGPEGIRPDDPGAIMSALIGAGWTFDRVVKGMQQLYHGATGNDKASGRDLKTAPPEGRPTRRQRLYEPLQDQHPIATAIGEDAARDGHPGGRHGRLRGHGRQAGAGRRGARCPGVRIAGDRAKRGAMGAAGAVAGGVVVPKAVEAAVKGVPAVGPRGPRGCGAADRERAGDDRRPHAGERRRR